VSLYRRENSKIWWISIKTGGRRISQSTGTENKKLSEKIHAKVITEIREDRYLETAKEKKITFIEMVGKYIF
jgi:hypothetical protein